MDQLQMLWSLTGYTLPSLVARSLTDVSDGVIPNTHTPTCAKSFYSLTKKLVAGDSLSYPGQIA